MRSSTRLLLWLVPAIAAAQDRQELKEILDRLARVEEQNRMLVDEVRALRKELAESRAGAPAAPSAPPVEERLEVAENRIAEQAQSKLESDHRSPVQLTGMVLFNAWLNGRSNGDSFNPTTASASTGQFLGGGTFRQSVIGLKFQGPRIAGGGNVSGSVYMDFFAGTASSLNQLFRLRLATVDLNWRNTTVSVGQDKPIIAPREPDSLAQVGVSPLTAAGNLWLWQPQARVEQRFHLSDSTILRGQFGVFQTSESYPGLSAEYRAATASARPSAEGRVEISHQFRGVSYIEVAYGIHASQSHVHGVSLPSRIYSFDWLIRPFARLDITGAYFTGQNVSVTGSIRQGITFFGENGRSVHSQGGWAQLALRPTSRLSFHLYGGAQDDRNADLLAGAIGRNMIYAANVMYRVGPNLLASFEASQVRTSYLGSGLRLNPHYDLALAYLF
ncbi:MAG: hypothetical protein JSU00_09460 [Acidobacteria bacterium]|nr:hypothetical protein [Acidobacteriota bacterium]